MTEVCPVCEREYPEPEIVLSILPKESADTCPNCRFPLRFSSTKSGDLEPSSIPQGIVLSDHGESWSATAYPRRTSAIETWGFSLLWTTCVTFMWSTDAARGAGIIIQVWLTVLTPVWVLKAILQTWGKYVVTGSPEGAHIFTGVGPLGWSRNIKWDELSEIRLRTRYGRRGSRQKSIFVEAGRHFCFGEELSDDQRHFLAVLLWSKRRPLHGT